MQKSTFEAILAAQRSSKEIYCHTITAADIDNGTAELTNGFFIILVTNGTTAISDTYDFEAGARDLMLLTPSMRAAFTDIDDTLSMICLGIDPDYFDSLRDGQAMYAQLSRFIRECGYPLLHTSPEEFDCLRRTLELFLSASGNLDFGRNAVTDRLCGFLLLQTAELLSRSNVARGPLCMKRSDLLFRHFKKLLVENYRRHHRIEFYADALHISTTYLARTVKRLTGHTVRFHIAELLCADARRLLDSTDMEVKQIADLLGFSDQSVFGKFFTKMTGISPVKYRMRSR